MKVSVVVPVYNVEKYLKRCLDSIINQTYRNWILLIRDDNSKDNTLEILKEYNRERNTTIVVTSSEIEELRSICDRIAIINEGKVAGILPATASILDFGKLMSGIKEGE